MKLRRYFNITDFMPILTLSMTKAANPIARIILINWISTLNSIPNIELFDQLPRFLEHLFIMLGDPNKFELSLSIYIET
jgi:vacuole morphology and inheritance protein 14